MSILLAYDTLCSLYNSGLGSVHPSVSLLVLHLGMLAHYGSYTTDRFIQMLYLIAVHVSITLVVDSPASSLDVTSIYQY